MIDHISVHVSDLDRSIAFYAAALAPLGYVVVMEFPGAAGLGVAGKPDLWLGKSEKIAPQHVAFRAERAQVGAFYEAAIAAGGKDNGKPGIREHYHPNYYGAFVIDPDGHNIEAVCHDPPVAAKKAAAKKAPAKKAAKKAPAKKAAAKKAPAKKAAAKKAPAKKAPAKKAAAKKAAAKKA
jgi:catechol 2,3-dioxygenase-like lactoylglutathione lyase family enzyme